MSNIRAFLILVTATLSFALASPASADAGPGKCTGQFVNPITDICWSCLFPISVGGLEIWPSNRPDPDNPDLPVCLCGLRPGIAMGFWEPVRLADVSMKPWCFVNLGGMKLDPGFDIGFRSISGPSAVGGASQYYSSWHVHWYAYRTKIEPFFSNLLPEGTLRDYLARRAGVKAVREYKLLAQLGHDLPGAVRAVAVDAEETEADELDEEAAEKQAERALRFSLAGVQLKFSAVKAQGKNGGLTIPVTGSGGDWIVKLPSARHPDVPEAEFAAMKLAAKIGIDVPEIDLLYLDQIDGIPEGITRYGESAFAIRRFDRGEEGPVHTEDFAQVFGVFADDKYENASYRQILNVLAIETDEQSVVEFVRRLTYSVLIGNGDMHLKNWSLIYPDRRNALLAPAYDLLSTLNCR